MTENDILLSLKEQMRAELSRIANAEIDKLVHKFTCEMGKHKAEFIAAIVNDVECLVKKDPIKEEITFQINIKGGGLNDR